VVTLACSRHLPAGASVPASVSKRIEWVPLATAAQLAVVPSGFPTSMQRAVAVPMSLLQTASAIADAVGQVSRVQRQWLRRHAGSALAHPHYWAGFVWLSGGTPREAVRTWR
jgi:hypothetical protein